MVDEVCESAPKAVAVGDPSSPVSDRLVSELTGGLWTGGGKGRIIRLKLDSDAGVVLLVCGECTGEGYLVVVKEIPCPTLTVASRSGEAGRALELPHAELPLGPSVVLGSGGSAALLPGPWPSESHPGVDTVCPLSTRCRDLSASALALTAAPAATMAAGVVRVAATVEIAPKPVLRSSVVPKVVTTASGTGTGAPCVVNASDIIRRGTCTEPSSARCTGSSAERIAPTLPCSGIAAI
jgi:hypothetical protein